LKKLRVTGGKKYENLCQLRLEFKEGQKINIIMRPVMERVTSK